MKIDVTGGYGIYRGNRAGESKATKSAPAGESKKATDVAEFSKGNTAIADKGLIALKSTLQQDINQPAKAERLEQLRADIKSGVYRVPTEALVDSILGD